MRRALFIGLLVAALLAGCAASPTLQPTLASKTIAPNKPTVQATAVVLPTDTPTALPSNTVELSKTPTSTRTPKPSKTPKPKEVMGCLAPAGMSGPTAPLKIENITNKKVTVYINGASRNGNFPIYCTEFVKQGIPVFITLMWGNYTYMVQFEGKTTLTGSFFINDFDKGTMQIFRDKVRIGTYP
jgi:hypothetical protein